MFCNQCEQTVKGIACTKIGVCGKNDEVAGLEDLLTHAVQGLSLVAHAGRQVGVVDNRVDRFTCEAIFSCLTNVDFDPARFETLIREAITLRDELRAKVEAAGGTVTSSAAALSFSPADSLAGLEDQGKALDFIPGLDANEDLRSLKQIIMYGLRGLAAYTDHAAILGKEDDAVYAFIHEAMAAITSKMELNDLVAMALKTGEVNVKAMELLDAGNTGTYGHPVPTEVPLGHIPGKCILVTGHDLKDLDMLLKQTEGKGITIYTHGEMLPCHGYPELKKYPHFYGHYGTAWQNQQKEMPEFPGAILFTTNCIQKPADSYKDNVFTTGLVGWPDVAHVEGSGEKDFSAVIDRALALDGFTDKVDNGSVMVGFARNAVLGVADKVIGAVKAKAIRHFFLVGGCDGAKPGRNYYTELVEKVPEDCMVLTLACGKFRFFDKKLGDIGGIPRLLDVGQCNDAYSAVQIAVALAGAFDCEVNDLPLSLVLSWYEQKAVVILLSLFSLGIKDIRLGPSLPAFITPNVLNVLVENFNIMPISTPDEDLKAILG
ncbi:hydroxylamine reductase [Desulfocapsa sulfexigens DSM 10523]|uniref:Hydroxylamine reductase n=1 Tax=Desulfocapsa sulfexigens (strain DSM 10523 / SB164P1) TaxID=1167006 RepID=M1P1F4_DESSD|nr:hydroxylamine reductase [Desulfocapsa sulfexigens]AGF77343.1 hydroxylamine reductase [Desulfocapsa sulfexigens DSM 10523]